MSQIADSAYYYLFFTIKKRQATNSKMNSLNFVVKKVQNLQMELQLKLLIPKAEDLSFKSPVPFRDEWP